MKEDFEEKIGNFYSQLLDSSINSTSGYQTSMKNSLASFQFALGDGGEVCRSKIIIHSKLVTIEIAQDYFPPKLSRDAILSSLSRLSAQCTLPALVHSLQSCFLTTT